MKQGIFLFCVTLLVNVLNYGLNIFLARYLGPTDFSEANLIATLVMGLSFAAMGLQLTATKLIAEKQLNDYVLLRNRVKKYSVLATLFLLAASPSISNYLQFDNYYSLVLVFSGIPFYFLLSIGRGLRQGQNRFMLLGLTYLVEGLIRCVVTFGLLLLMTDAQLSSCVVSCGFLFSFVITYFWNDGIIKNVTPSSKLNNASRFLFIMSLYELSQVLINNSDVVLVKHYFMAEEAGLYSSLAILGKAVFFATWVVVMILFPKVIEKEKLGQPHLTMFLKALLVVGLIGSAMVLGSYVLGDLVLSLAFGEVYSEMADGLWLYALLTCCFACANVFVYYNLSLERYMPVYIALVIGVAQIFFINLFHSSISEVITVQLCMMIFFLLAMCIYQFVPWQLVQNSTSNSVKHI